MSGGTGGRPKIRADRWFRQDLAVVFALTSLGGCTTPGPSRAEVDAQVYAACVRSGGVWYGDSHFGGRCEYRGPSR